MQVAVHSLENKKIRDVDVDDKVFGLPYRSDLLQKVVEWQLAKRRAGTHASKGISQISGTTKKPYKQKGTGNARQGSLRSPQFRGGAVIFGPVVRSHAFDLPKKVRKLGLKIALSFKAAQGKLFIIDSLQLTTPKTSELTKVLTKLNMESALFIDGDTNDTFKKASSNLFKVHFLPQIGANVYDILKYDNLVISEAALAKLQERLQ